jgi:hypothetical protein
MLAFIQIVNLRASSTPVNNKNQPGTYSSTREGNAGTGFIQAWAKRCYEYSIFKPGLVTNKRSRVMNTTLRGLAGVYQCRINIIVVSSNHHHTQTIPLQTLLL